MRTSFSWVRCAAGILGLFTLAAAGCGKASREAAPLGSAHCSVTQTCKVLLAWDHPDPSTVGFRIYYGNAPQVQNPVRSYEHMIDIGSSPNNEATVPNLGTGTWYFAATAYQSDVESAFSNEVSVEINAQSPAILRVGFQGN